MHPTILITGGCRSGKSRHALHIGADLGGQRNFFIATCVPKDEEMRVRVRRHQKERGPQWKTLEVPIKLEQAIKRHGPEADVMLIDCLTLWISNHMAKNEQDAMIFAQIEALVHIISKPPCPIVLVSNEVGAGIVPENPVARRFRDIIGWTNQRVAAACSKVIWMVAGIDVTIKPHGE